MIRQASIDDADAIRAIYNDYVENTIITFEERALTLNEMKDRIAETIQSLPWLVDEEDGRVIGYAYASGWMSRRAFRFSVESTIYIARDQVGKGKARPLYEALIAALRSGSSHSIIAGIALPNPASVALHEKMGFEKVGQFKEVGRKFDQWIDVGYWMKHI